MLAFGRLIIPEMGVAGLRDPFQNFTPLNFSAMAEDRIVKFCARVFPRNSSRVMTNYPPSGSGHGHETYSFLANKR